MKARTSSKAAWVLAGVLFAGASACGAAPETLAGSIVGYVTNPSGLPQMGATVVLFNGLDRMVHRALTDEAGSFLFHSLAPGVYSVRVTLASFLPALKRNIVVQPGMRSLLSVNLAGVLSSIELVYSSRSTRAVMSDDWKWTLRGGAAVRPVLRFTGPAMVAENGLPPRPLSEVFSNTRGVVKVSAGEQAGLSHNANEPDLGTAFALATSVFGKNSVHVSGNIGFSAETGAPAAGFRTSFSRGRDGENRSPEINLTLRQLYLPSRVGLLSGHQGAAPALRTMSVGMLDRMKLTEALEIEYGFTLESVSFLNTLNYFSPFGRVAYNMSDRGVVTLAFSSGLPPAHFFTSAAGATGDLQQDLAALAAFPRVSLRGGRARVQRTGTWEVSYKKPLGSRTLAVAGYMESVRNAAVTMVFPGRVVPQGDFLPDLLSNSAVFNVGDYSSAGYMASLVQPAGEKVTISLMAGSGSALIPSGALEGGDAPQLRRTLHHGQRRWAAARVNAKMPVTGTALTASYRWADGETLTAPHEFLTEPSMAPGAGLNFHVRQPVPGFAGMRGRLELTGDVRNLLGQGYLGVSTGKNADAVLMHTPRSIRGGVSFIF